MIGRQFFPQARIIVCELPSWANATNGGIPPDVCPAESSGRRLRVDEKKPKILK